jgi:hypothetical protein
MVRPIQDNMVEEHLNKKLGKPDTGESAVFASKPLAQGAASNSEALVSLVAALWKWPSELTPPALLDLPREVVRVSHLSDLMDISREATCRDNLSLAFEIAKHVLEMSLLSLRAQPVHPRMFSSKDIFSTEEIRKGVGDALFNRLALEKRQGGANRVTKEALAVTLEDWDAPRYVSLTHIEHMASTVIDNIADGGLNSAPNSSGNGGMVTNLIAITETIVSVVGRFNGEGCQTIGRLDLPVKYTEAVPEYLIEHHLLTSSEEELSDFFNAAIAMIHCGSVAPPLKTEPGDFEIKDFPMNYASMLETGRRILVAMYQLSVPISPEAHVTLAAYGKDKLNLPESIDNQVSDMVRSTRGFFTRNSEQE